MSQQISSSTILKFYQAFSPPFEQLDNPAFQSCIFPFWVNPAMGIVYPKSVKVSVHDLSNLEKAFREIPKKYDFNDGKSYLQVFESKHKISSSLASKLRNEGWSNHGWFVFNYWKAPAKFSKSSEFNVQIAPYAEESSLFEDYLHFSKTVFGKDKKFVREMLKINRSLLACTKLVAIMDSRNKAVAIGCVCTRESKAWLFGGCVSPKYRGRGIWTLLTAQRQLTSLEDGAKEWMLVTNNEQIAAKSPYYAKAQIFEKQVRSASL